MAETAGAECVAGFVLEHKMEMTGKLVVLAAAAVLVGWIHLGKKKQWGLSWDAYGRRLLGLGPVDAGRKGYLDDLRFLAVILVILVHSMQSASVAVLSVSGITMEEAVNGVFLNGRDKFLWRFLTGAAGLGLCCNLLFVMISGALLLPYREEPAGTFYRKRCSKIVIPLAAYYVFYLHRSGLVSFSLPQILGAFKAIISGPMELMPHFWLVYVLTGLYVSVPFFRWMLKSLPWPVVKTLGGVILLGIMVKTGLYFWGLGFGFQVFLFSWEGIFLMGYVLTREEAGVYDKILMLCGILSAVLIFQIFCTRGDAAAAAANDSALMLVFSMAVFRFFCWRGSKKKQGKKRILRQMTSRYSYSILLIHWFMLFVVVEKHLHIGPLMFGGKWLLAGMLLQSAAALLLSLIFAVGFDQTVVLMAEWIWEKLLDFLCEFYDF